MSNDETMDVESRVIRVLYSILFYGIYKIADLIVLLVFLVQVFFTLFTGRANDTVEEFSARLADYIAHLVGYLGGSVSLKPYPFSDFPEAHKND